jgi:hypothetical protein
VQGFINGGGFAGGGKGGEQREQRDQRRARDESESTAKQCSHGDNRGVRAAWAQARAADDSINGCD